MVILGAISSFATELVVPGTYHFMRLKSDIPSQVSSIFKKTFLFLAYVRNSIAHLCLKTKFFSELEWRATVLIFRYLISMSSFITCLTWSSFTCSPVFYRTSLTTIAEESIIFLFKFKSSIVSCILSRFFIFKSLSLINSAMKPGFFLDLSMS